MPNQNRKNGQESTTPKHATTPTYQHHSLLMGFISSLLSLVITPYFDFFELILYFIIINYSHQVRNAA